MVSRRSTRIINARGFTLVEAIVASAVSVVVGAVMLTILQMNNNGVSNGALNARIQMQYETVVSQISQNARFANVVLTSSESWPPAANAAAATGISQIDVYNAIGTKTGGYKIVGTALQEYVGATWINFKVGPNAVQVTSGSGFSLTADRKWLTLNLSVFSTFLSLKDTALSKREAYICRN